jgi:UDP-N-acetyl-2-amino-2-deoxyglucuronate dehydrogenase
MKSYTTAFIGCGQRGRAHAAAVAGDARLRVVAAADVKRDAAEDLLSQHGFAGANAFGDHRAMLAECRPQVVVVSLWTPLHLPVFRDCIEAGAIAVLCEKPMAPTWGDCLEMARLAEQSGCQLTFCHQRRYAPGNRYIRQLLADGHLGAIERMDLYSPANLLDCGTHTIDQAMSFNGDQPVKWALGAVDASELHNWFDVKSETMATGTLVFANGVRAHLQAGGPDMDLWGGVRVHCSDGFVAAMWDGAIRRAVKFSDPAWQAQSFPEKGDSEAIMSDMIHDVVDCLETGRPCAVGHQAALRVTEAIYALYESVRRHRRIALPLKDTTDNPFTAMLATGTFGAPAVRD